MKTTPAVLPIYDVFHTMHEMTRRALASHTIWFGLHAQQEGGGPHAILLQLHYPFFTAIYDATIHFTILTLSDLFGKRSGVHSFRFLIAHCLSEGRISAEQACDCRLKLNKLSKAARGVGILRGKHFGHKLLGAPIADVLREADLKIKHIDELLAGAFLILGDLAFACGEHSYEGEDDFERHAKDSLQDVFECLTKKWNALGGAQLQSTN